MCGQLAQSRDSQRAGSRIGHFYDHDFNALTYVLPCHTTTVSLGISKLSPREVVIPQDPDILLPDSSPGQFPPFYMV